MLSVVLAEARIIQDPACPSVVLEGRRAGLIGWMLHRLGLARLSLQLDSSSVQWLAASIRGQQRLHAPADRISDVVAGSRRPVLPLLLLPVVALFGVLAMLVTRALGVLVPTALVCAILMLIVMFRQRVFLSIRLRSGATLALQWKRGVVEGVTVDQALAQRMAEAIREAVLLSNEREIALSAQELEDVVTAAAAAMRADTDVERAWQETMATATSTRASAAPHPSPPPLAVPAVTGPPIPASPVAAASTYAPPVTMQPPTPTPPFIGRAERIEPRPIALHADVANGSVDSIRATNPPPPPREPALVAPAEAALVGPPERTTWRLPEHSQQQPTDLPPARETAPPTRPFRRRNRHMPIVLGAVVLLAAVGGGWWTLLAPRTVIVRNELLVDVLLTLPDGTMAPVTARSRKSVLLPRGDLSLSWDVADREVFRGSNLAEALLGDPVRVASAADSVILSVRTLAQPVFAPLISNRSTDAVRVVVNAGLRDQDGMIAESECLCRILPSAEDEFIGYYRAYANSAVSLISSDGRSVTFSDVAGESSPRSGAIQLRLSPR